MSAFQDPDIYRDILNQLQVGVCVLDLENRIVFWSDGAEQISGYGRIDVLGHPCSQNILLHCNQQSCELCAETCPTATALHEAKPVEAQGFIHHKSGHGTAVHTWTIPLRDKKGSIIGIIQTFDGHSVVDAPDSATQAKQRGWLDEVTGLPNPAMTHAHLRETLASFTDAHIPFGIILLEFSDLAAFRARYGQGAARSILQVLARTVRNTVWPTDFVGRWDEGRFLVILMGCSDDGLHAVSARMRRMMAGATISWWGEELSTRVSLGCAAAIAGETVDGILQRATQAFEQDGNSAPSVASACTGPDRG